MMLTDSNCVVGYQEVTAQKVAGGSTSNSPAYGAQPHSLHAPSPVGRREELPLLAPVPLQSAGWLGVPPSQEPIWIACSQAWLMPNAQAGKQFVVNWDYCARRKCASWTRLRSRDSNSLYSVCLMVQNPGSSISTSRASGETPTSSSYLIVWSDKDCRASAST